MSVISIDLCTTGINAFDSPENMAPTDAVALENWICRPGMLESRPPRVTFVNPASDTTGICAVYHGADGNQLLYNRSDSVLFDISDGTQTSLGTSVADPLGTWFLEINGVIVVGSGAGTEKAYNGSSLVSLNYAGSSPAIPSSGAFTGACNFKGRAIYINAGQLVSALAAVNSFWYAEAGSYQGNITEFPLDSVSHFGGNPVSIGVWTMDTGTGPDDVLVIYYSTGEILIYQGDDPGDADNWEIVGSFRIGKPQSKHSILSYGSDMILLSQSGYVSMKDVLKSDQLIDGPNFSRRIWPLIEDQIAHDPTGRWLDYNRASVWGSSGLILFTFSHDSGADCIFCLNPATNAWSVWTNCFAPTGYVEFEGELYFADTSFNISKFSDHGTSSETVTCSAIPAFTDLGDPTARKQVTAVQFSTNHPDPALIEVTGYSDFNLEGTLPTATAYAGGGAPSEATVGVFPKVRKAMAHTFTRGWQNLHAFGYYVSMAVQMATSDRTLYWRATNIRYRKGGR